MQCIRLAVILFAAGAVASAQTDFSGTWRAVFTDPPGDRPKMVSEMTFEFKIENKKLTGVAHMSVWPGDAPISEGKIDGDHVMFTTIGTRPWWSSSVAGKTTASGYPKLVFDGTLKDGEIVFKLDWNSVMIIGEPGPGHEFHMKAKRIAQ